MRGAISSIPILVALLVSSCRSHAPSPSDPPTIRQEDVSFRNGSATLAGTLYLPPGTGPHPAIVAFHPANGGTRDFHAYAPLAKLLPPAGFAVLLYDRRGEGGSTGDPATSTFEDLADDGLAGVSFLRSRPDVDVARIGVWGVSQGGWLGPLAASRSHDVRFVVSVSGPGVSPARQMAYGAQFALESAGESREVVARALDVRAKLDDYYRGRAEKSDVERAIAAIRSEPWFDQVYLPGGGELPDDPAHSRWRVEMDYDPLRALARVDVPILFLFAETDKWVPINESIANIRSATKGHSEVTIRRVPGTDHLMETGPPGSHGPISEAYARELVDWLRRVAR